MLQFYSKIKKLSPTKVVLDYILKDNNQTLVSPKMLLNVFCCLGFFTMHSSAIRLSIETFFASLGNLTGVLSDRLLTNDAQDSAVVLNFACVTRLAFAPRLYIKTSKGSAKQYINTGIESSPNIKRHDLIIKQSKVCFTTRKGLEVTYNFDKRQLTRMNEAMVRVRDSVGLNIDSASIRFFPQYWKHLKMINEHINVYYSNALNVIIKYILSSSGHSYKLLIENLKLLSFRLLPLSQHPTDRICKLLAQPGVVYEDEVLIGAAYDPKMMELIQTAHFPLTPEPIVFGSDIKGLLLFYCLWTLDDKDPLGHNYVIHRNTMKRQAPLIKDKPLINLMPLLNVSEQGIICQVLEFPLIAMNRLIGRFKNVISPMPSELIPIDKEFKTILQKLSLELKREARKEISKFRFRLQK